MTGGGGGGGALPFPLPTEAHAPTLRRAIEIPRMTSFFMVCPEMLLAIVELRGARHRASVEKPQHWPKVVFEVPGAELRLNRRQSLQNLARLVPEVTQ